ncbi:MAG: L,D-transpeptidase family protein [Gaiellales bacterium]
MSERRTRPPAPALALLVLMGAGAAVADAKPARVKGDRILDGSRQELKVRGVVWGDGRFAPIRAGQGLPAPSTAGAGPAFRQIQRIGGNVVRVNVSSLANTPQHRRALMRLQRLARSRGLVLLLANHAVGEQDQTPWLRELAGWFAGKDNVWYLPEVDPDCGLHVSGAACGDTESWIWSQQRHVRALRSAGVRTPIVLNLPDGSRSVGVNWLRAIRDRNVVYGVHPPADGRTRFDRVAGEHLAASLGDATASVPVIFDSVSRVQTVVEVRQWTSGSGLGRIERTVHTSRDTMRWSSGQLDWLIGWTVLDGGDGAIVSGMGTDSRNAMTAGARKLTAWGRVAAAGFFAVGFRAASGRDPGSGYPGGFELGDRGPGVRSLQQQLARLGYLSPRFANGTYGDMTWHAVNAFQGYNRQTRDGVAGARTVARLMRAERPVARHPEQGQHVAVDLRNQILMLVNGRGRVERVVQISTGSAGNTPAGRFSVTRKERMSWSKPFKQWLPYAAYFFEGIAFHEYGEVPNYPASHGCVRLPHGDAPVVFAFTDVGTPVIVDR